jgi:hypothetical protein
MRVFISWPKFVALGALGGGVWLILISTTSYFALTRGPDPSGSNVLTTAFGAAGLLLCVLGVFLALRWNWARRLAATVLLGLSITSVVSAVWEAIRTRPYDWDEVGMMLVATGLALVSGLSALLLMNEPVAREFRNRSRGTGMAAEAEGNASNAP